MGEPADIVPFPEREIGLPKRAFLSLAIKYGHEVRMACRTFLMLRADLDHLRSAIEREKTKIYFVQMGKDGPIKIGKADNPSQRLRELQCGNPYRLSILCVLDSFVRREGQLHRQFADHRLEGEWFEPQPVIAWLQAMGALP